MYGLNLLYLVILVQFMVTVLPTEIEHHREVRQSGGQPVVNPGQGGTQNAGNGDPQAGPNSGGIPGMPDPGAPFDTRGTEFIFCFTSNVQNARPAGLKLLIGAGGPMDTLVTVRIPQLQFGVDVELPQGGTEIVDIPPAAGALGSGFQNGTIWVRANRPISVHGMNMQIKSHDGFLAIPVLGLGLEYFAASYAASGSERSQLLISGSQDFTRLQIIPVQRMLYNGRWFNIGDTILLTLNRFQTVQIQTQGDLTGTRIRADQPVSVMSGATCSLVPQQLNRCDHLVENIPPVATWGKRYSVMPFRNRTTGHIIRVISARPRTRIYALGQVYILQRGGLFREFNQPITFPMSIVADKPILVVQYSKGGQMDKTGDPFMTIIPSVEQYVAGSVTFSSFDVSGRDTFRSFASISVTSWDLYNIYVNNEPLLSHKYVSTEKEDWLRLMTFNADYQMELSKGSNTIASPAPNSRFAAIAYGFAPGTSYAFPLVYGLRRLLCTPQNTAAGDPEEDCTGPIVSGIVLSTNHGTGLGIQPPRAPAQGESPGWGNFNPSKTGSAREGNGGGDAGVFFPWYTIPPWQAEQWEEEMEEDEQVCYSTNLLILGIIAPAIVVFLVMLIIICALLFRIPGETKF